MLFYFVRHGQTEANRQQVLAGSGLDHPLNEQGHAQAQRLASRVRELLSHPVHRIVASSMTRARQTAEYLAKDLELPLDVHAGLREWHLGEWEGQPYAHFAHLLLGEGEPARGESRQQFYARVRAAWDEIHDDRKPYVLVSHGAVWLAMQDLLGIPRFKVSNCDLVRLEFRDGTWTARNLCPTDD